MLAGIIFCRHKTNTLIRINGIAVVRLIQIKLAAAAAAHAWHHRVLSDLDQGDLNRVIACVAGRVNVIESGRLRAIDRMRAVSMRRRAPRDSFADGSPWAGRTWKLDSKITP
ncbi:MULTISPECIES: hypothetical protein [Rhodopseudomonas]|uniref:hypothetical protein n=1 Tax=Rhodopseudomonas TaxID=1073 RepID=UPI000AE755FA|nr:MULTISPECIES: hypothetical protein [Rhodopseudomonas]MDF3809902.1 hypothetical protein [Rhodopseudomonas sp. BAL398]WOK17926.1 hypothetical protein RBJ75_28105 [Rhodopseudomonas sp. BAL398]